MTSWASRPTGAAVRFTVIDIVRLRGGQFVEHWGMVDQLGLLQQLGAISQTHRRHAASMAAQNGPQMITVGTLTCDNTP